MKICLCNVNLHVKVAILSTREAVDRKQLRRFKRALLTGRYINGSLHASRCQRLRLHIVSHPRSASQMICRKERDSRFRWSHSELFYTSVLSHSRLCPGPILRLVAESLCARYRRSLLFAEDVGCRACIRLDGSLVASHRACSYTNSCMCFVLGSIHRHNEALYRSRSARHNQRLVSSACLCLSL